MESKASKIFNFNVSMKQAREEVKPLKDTLIENMLSTGKRKIPAGADHSIILVEKKTKKTVSVKSVMLLVEKHGGADLLKQIKDDAEKLKGNPIVKYSLKFVENESEE